ncbi:hypothetical protein chiPu_0028444, partial [Chiloscyllium punctatum]|nr:hypothetical protein [Chiloscyllium punctatum]
MRFLTIPDVFPQESPDPWKADSQTTFSLRGK